MLKPLRNVIRVDVGELTGVEAKDAVEAFRAMSTSRNELVDYPCGNDDCPDCAAHEEQLQQQAETSQGPYRTPPECPRAESARREAANARQAAARALARVDLLEAQLDRSRIAIRSLGFGMLALGFALGAQALVPILAQWLK
jgi:hypothetical protein